MSKKEFSNSTIKWGTYTPNASANCPHLLPCGICEKTNRYCPLKNSEPSWLSTKITDTMNISYCEEKKND